MFPLIHEHTAYHYEDEVRLIYDITGKSEVS